MLTRLRDRMYHLHLQPFAHTRSEKGDMVKITEVENAKRTMGLNPRHQPNKFAALTTLLLTHTGIACFQVAA
jgi:hypothetical protein